MPATDHELLENFLTTGDDASFAELVRRHLGLVYSAALRITSEPSLAEEVSQLVFVKLARLRSPMRAGLLLVTWLHRTTRSTAIDLVRAESRRRQREQIAASLAMNQTSNLWEEISPVLDDVIDRLPAEERHLVLSRFFEGQSLAELGRALGLSEDAVRMRVNRSLAKIRDMLQKRGITTTAAALTAALPAYGSVAVPSGLASTVVSTAVASFTPSISILAYAITIMTQKTAIIAAAVLLVAGIGTAVYTASNSKDVHSTGPAGPEDQPAAGISSGLDSPALSPSRARDRQSSNDGSGADGDLVSTYGESRVKLAKRITSSIIGFLGPDGIGGFAAVMAEQTGKKSLDDLSKKLAMNDSQQQQAREAYQKFQARRSQQLTSSVERLSANSKTFSEVLLAGDAYKRNKISKQEYDAIAGKFDVEAATMRPMSPANLMADAEFVNALKSCLDPAQVQLLEKETPNPPEQPIVVNSSGAEALAKAKAEAVGSRQDPPAQVIALNMDMDFNQPETLENLDTKVTSMANTIKGLNAVIEGSKRLQDTQ